MDFTLTDEQLLIQHTAARFADAQHPLVGRWDGGAPRPAFDPHRWSGLAELGLLGLLVPEASGGIGAGPVELMVVMRALGRRLATDPFASTAVVGARVLAGTSGTTAASLRGLLAGDVRLAIAWHEPGDRYALQTPETVARRTADGWLLSGVKHAADTAGATHILVSARIGADTPTVGLFLLPRGQTGLHVAEQATFDGRSCARCVLTDLPCPPDAMIAEDAAALLEEALDWGVAALCCEAVGAMDSLVEQTVEYLRTRQQFGQPIAQFQALRHRVAEMEVERERAAAICLHAVAHLDADAPAARARAVSAAKVVVDEAGRFIGEQAVQLHGGIGVTDALAIGHFLKRITAIAMTWGDAEYHLDRFVGARP